MEETGNFVAVSRVELLKAYCAHHGKTMEEFEAQVLPKMRELILDVQNRIMGGAYAIRNNVLQIVFGVEGMYHFELGDRICDVELALVDEGWQSICMLQMPGAPCDFVLQDFCRTAMDSLFNED